MSSLASSLPHSLNRTVRIRATPATVFGFFTDSTQWASWWGQGSTIDARVGGSVRICYPGGINVVGTVLEISAPHRLVFTYGFESGTPIAAGSSRVTITVTPDPVGTLLALTHEFAEPDAAVRDGHVQGWRYQLSIFANLTANTQHADAASVVDAWFDAWADPNANSRSATFTRIASPGILFGDRYSSLESLPDLLAHVTATQHYMPGIRMTRAGEVRHCQGMVLADFTAASADGTPVMRGTNVFVFGPSGMLESVTGFSGPL